MTAAILEKSEAVKAGARALSIIDVAAGLALLAEEWNYCRPAVDGSRQFCIEGGRHPVVEQALRRQSATAFIAMIAIFRRIPMAASAPYGC